MTTTIPAQMVSIVRSAALTEMGEAAEQIAQASLGYEKERHPEHFSEPLIRFDRARALVDALRWSDHERIINLDVHAQALARALEARLAVERNHAQDPSTEPTSRRVTECVIDWLEGFLLDSHLRSEDS